MLCGCLRALGTESATQPRRAIGLLMTRLLRIRWGPAVLGISSSGGGFGFSPQTLTLSAVFLSPLQPYHRGIGPLALGRWQVARACHTAVQLLPLLSGSAFSVATA